MSNQGKSGFTGGVHGSHGPHGSSTTINVGGSKPIGTNTTVHGSVTVSQTSPTHGPSSSHSSGQIGFTHRI